MRPGLEAAELPADAVEVGRVTDAWGLQGWFKVLPYSADPQALFSCKRWFLLPSETGAIIFPGVAQLAIKEARSHSDTVIASAHEVEDRTTAEALRGARIFIPRSSFPSTDKDQYYWVDLIGLNVANRQGIALGTVKELRTTGAQTVLVIDDEQDGKTHERMIPFVSVYVDDVDLPGRRILVDWQADY